jgi:acetyl-CoA acetyltransferase
LKEIDVAEISEKFSYEELLWMEGLGLCELGGGGKLIDSGVTKMGGKLPVNPSGGCLSGNPTEVAGMTRVVEAVLQLIEIPQKRIPRPAEAEPIPSGLGARRHRVVELYHAWAGGNKQLPAPLVVQSNAFQLDAAVYLAPLFPDRCKLNCTAFGGKLPDTGG